MIEIGREILEGGSDIIHSNGNGRPSMGAGPVERIVFAKPVLPCPSCIHREVCGIAARLASADFGVRAPASPDPAVRVSVTVAVECLHFLADPILVGRPEAQPAAAAKGATVAESRARGTAASAAKRTKSPETRERMRLAQLAIAARKRAVREAASTQPDSA